jgi:hypothetical protein
MNYEVEICIGLLEDLDKVKLKLRVFPGKDATHAPHIQNNAQLRIKTWFKHKEDHTVHTVQDSDLGTPTIYNITKLLKTGLNIQDAHGLL